MRPTDVSTPTFGVLCALVVLLAGCEDGGHAGTSWREPSSGGDSPAVVVTTFTSGPHPDAVADMNKIRGTMGDDRLLGASGRDLIDGRRGSDIIRGRAGDDVLKDYTGIGTGRRLDTTPDAFYGGPGDDLIYSSQHDRVNAGPGDDTIVAYYLVSGDVIRCGPGRDVVVENDDYTGIVLRGCEKVRVRYAG